MATVSDSEVLATNTQVINPSRASAAAVGAQNVILVAPFSVASPTTFDHKGVWKLYLTTAVPSDTNCLGASIGDCAIAILVDTAQSSVAPYTARWYIKNSSGWQYASMT